MKLRDGWQSAHVIRVPILRAELDSAEHDEIVASNVVRILKALKAQNIEFELSGGSRTEHRCGFCGLMNNMRHAEM